MHSVSRLVTPERDRSVTASSIYRADLHPLSVVRSLHTRRDTNTKKRRSSKLCSCPRMHDLLSIHPRMHDRPSEQLTELVTGMGAALTDLSRVIRVMRVDMLFELLWL